MRNILEIKSEGQERHQWASSDISSDNCTSINLRRLVTLIAPAPLRLFSLHSIFKACIISVLNVHLSFFYSFFIGSNGQIYNLIYTYGDECRLKSFSSSSSSSSALFAQFECPSRVRKSLIPYSASSSFYFIICFVLCYDHHHSPIGNK